MRILLSHPFELRLWRPEDEEALARHANNRNIWRNLRDGFPHPYRREDAHRFLDRVIATPSPSVFCIATDQEAIGGIGLHPREDVERFSAELGYWLSEAYWGRGIVSEAVRAVTRWGEEERGLHRIFAIPYAWNPASCRVLEKAGYSLEGRMKASAFKDGVFVDQLLYAHVRSTHD